MIKIPDKSQVHGSMILRMCCLVCREKRYTNIVLRYESKTALQSSQRNLSGGRDTFMQAQNSGHTQGHNSALENYNVI